MIFGLLGGLIKQKPKVPTFKEVSAAEEQLGAVRANQAAFGEASALAGQVNEYNQAELMKQLEAVIPGIRGIQTQTSKNIESQLRGEIPDDVGAAVTRYGAAQSFGKGTSGSRFAGNLTTRDLGLTSMNITQYGLDNASRWIATARSTMTAPQMDVTSMFITPQQMVQNTWANRQATFNREWLQSQLNAEYDWRTVLGNQMQQDEALTMNMISGLIGGQGMTPQMTGQRNFSGPFDSQPVTAAQQAPQGGQPTGGGGSGLGKMGMVSGIAAMI